jgi:hypothetical protein
VGAALPLTFKTLRLPCDKKIPWVHWHEQARALALSACLSVHRALGIRFFEERKLVSVEERWRKLRAQHDIASAQLVLPLR